MSHLLAIGITMGLAYNSLLCQSDFLFAFFIKALFTFLINTYLH